MARFKRYRRRFNKRNVERCIRAGSAVVSEDQQVVAYTWTATEACTVKSIKLDAGIVGTGEGAAYCLVRVEEGYAANAIVYPAVTGDMYNPTAQVLISGVLTDGGVEDHKYNMIGRKMKAGDRMALLVRAMGNGGTNFRFEMNFSVLT